MKNKPIKIFTGNANVSLAQTICENLHIKLSRAIVSRFNDGEVRVQIDETVRGADVFIIQPTYPPAEHWIELLMMIDAAKMASASRVTAVVPYYGYARQDRKDQPRVSITARLFAKLIAQAGADRFLSIDLHAAQIQGFFDVPTDHIYALPIFLDYIKDLKFQNLTIAAPDVGGVKRARHIANILNVPLVIIDKRRPAPGEAEVMNIIGDVEGRDVIIIDDLIDTANTLVNAAKALKEHKANCVFALATHSLLSKNALQLIVDSPLEKVVVTDTIPVPPEKQHIKFEVLSVANLLSEAIHRIHNGISVSVMFNYEK